MAKFRVIEKKKSYGAAGLQKHFQKNKEWEDYKKKVADEKEKAEKEKKGVKEQTTAGSMAAAPAGSTPFSRADSNGNLTTAVMPLGTKKKKKRRLAKRVLPTI